MRFSVSDRGVEERKKYQETLTKGKRNWKKDGKMCSTDLGIYVHYHKKLPFLCENL